jgi:hypothetical protein
MTSRGLFETFLVGFFLYRLRDEDKFQCFVCGYQDFPAQFIQEAVLLQCIFLMPLLRLHWLYACGFISCSTGFSVCLYTNTTLLGYYGSAACHEIRYCDASNFVLLFKFVLAIQGFYASI